jgi:hypothetical protein
MFNADADLHYTRQGNGYLLYSVGKNGKDDGGQGFKEWEKSRHASETAEYWDDLVVRVPAKP